MPQLNGPLFRRDYQGEAVTFADTGNMKSLFVNSREFPHDRDVKSAIVLGNGISRLEPQIQLILNQNNKRVVEGYKTTYACNAAYRDTPADYYIIKNNIFFSEIQLEQYSKMFVSNDSWVVYREANLIPHIYYMDSGSTAAYLAAFDGAQKIFMFGFDGGDDQTNNNIYANTLGYEDNNHPYDKHNAHLYNVCKAYRNVEFYRVKTQYSYEFIGELKSLPNYFEISVREAVLIGDF